MMSDSQPARETSIARKKANRKLTPFLAGEMLYDYAMDLLDADRKQAIEEYLKSDKECQTLLEGIKRSLKYTSKLTEAQARPEVLRQLRESESALSLGRRYSSWREWPEALRWSVTAIAVSAVVAGAVAIFPWSKLPAFKQKPSNTVEVAQIPQPTADAVKDLADKSEAVPAEEGSGDDAGPDADEGAPVAATTVAAANLAPLARPGAKVAPAKLAAGESDGDEGDGSGDEIDDGSAASATAAAAKTAAAQAAASAAVPTVPVETKPSSAALVAAKIKAPISAATTAVTTVVSDAANSASQGIHSAVTAVAGVAADVSEASADKKDPHLKGFVYRVNMTLHDLDDIGPKISDQIRELGGEKAGEVELGWKRGTGRYYHFALPEANEKKLTEELQAYGPVRISKDPHSRVMPKGQVRFILWVESAD
jgi:hypothetical protein